MNPKGWIIKRFEGKDSIYLAFNSHYCGRVSYGNSWVKDITKANVFHRKHHAKVSSRKWEDSVIIPLYKKDLDFLYEGYIIRVRKDFMRV